MRTQTVIKGQLRALRKLQFASTGASDSYCNKMGWESIIFQELSGLLFIASFAETPGKDRLWPKISSECAGIISVSNYTICLFASRGPHGSERQRPSKHPSPPSFGFKITLQALFSLWLLTFSPALARKGPSPLQHTPTTRWSWGLHWESAYFMSALSHYPTPTSFHSSS